LRTRELTFLPYAEAHCTQQNAQISGETFQDHRSWQGPEGEGLATPSVVHEKRETQTPARQNSARRPDRCGANKGESSFQLTGLWLVTKVRRRRDLLRCSSCSYCRRRACGRRAVPLPCSFQGIRCGLGAVKVTPIDERCARCRRNENRNEQEKREPLHLLDANRSATRCQCADTFNDTTTPKARSSAPRFRVARLSSATKFQLRQGLWIEDLQTPPGQECSNGSMILLAVVLWRALFC
jgi:hypothetical protein